MGNSGCERSSAWICVLSSAHNTSALSDGCKYRPTISRTFSINRGFLEELKSCGRDAVARKPKLIQHIHDSKHSWFVCSQNQSEIHAWILAVQSAHEMFR